MRTRLVAQAVKRAQGGDRDAIGFLYSCYADDVHGCVRSIVRDAHDAEDLTQQVFARLIDVIGKYEERGLPFLAWVLRVARNLAVDHLRSRRPIPVEEVWGGRTVDSGRTDQMADLREALCELPKDQCEILLMRHYVGLSPTEIAARMGRSEGAVHGLHHRGRRTLRAGLISRRAGPATA